jgi:hypothetical protein
MEKRGKERKREKEIQISFISLPISIDNLSRSGSRK